MMRTAILCLSMLAVAGESAAQKDLEKERVTLRFNKVPIEEVVRPLTKSLGYELVLEPGLSAAPVTIQVENVTARTALTAVCESIGAVWEKAGKAIYIGHRGIVAISKYQQWRPVASLDEELGLDMIWFSIPLRDAVTVLGRAFNASVDAAPEVAVRRISASIRSQTLRQTLDVVCSVADCQWEIEELPHPPGPPYPSRIIHIRDRIYEGGEPGVTVPAVVTERKPAYTADAMRQKVEGVVTVSAVVLPDGSIGDVAVVNSLDQRYGLDDEAIKAVRQWRFRPGSKDGRPVAVRVKVELMFSLTRR